MKITLEYLRTMSQDDLRTMKPEHLLEARGLLRSTMETHHATCLRILDSADGRSLTASQQKGYDEAARQVDELGAIRETIDDQITARAISRTGVVPPGAGDRTPEYREGLPLTDRQTFAGFARSQKLVADDEEPLSLRKTLRGIVLGEWDGAETERRAMSGATLTGGGHMLPTVLAADIIDLARNQARVLEAGARVFPMANRTVDVAKWVSDPTAAWRSENAQIAASDATLGKITLNARTLAGLTLISRELLEDADEVDSELRQAFASVIGLKIDQAALYGTGNDPEPRGVKNANPAVLTASMGTNGGALTNFDPLIDAVGTLRDNNENPNAVIYSPRTSRTLAKLKDNTLQPLQVPGYLDGIRRLETNQVPNTLTQGTATTASDIFTGDWSQLYVGVRTQLQINVLSERYADTGQVGLMTWWRGDIAVARPKAFHITTGVL